MARIKMNGGFIACEDVQYKCSTAFILRQPLRLLYKPTRNTATPALWRHVKSNDVADSFRVDTLHMEDDKTHQRVFVFRNRNTRFRRFCKTAHRTAAEAKRLLEAHHIERMHRVQVIHAVRT